jgi:hypothetical protein
VTRVIQAHKVFRVLKVYKEHLELVLRVQLAHRGLKE